MIGLGIDRQCAWCEVFYMHLAYISTVNECPLWVVSGPFCRYYLRVRFRGKSGRFFDPKCRISRVLLSARSGRTGLAGLMHPIYALDVLELERSSDEYA